MKITFISDTHTRHDEITQDLPGGDILIHAGDIMNSGYNEGDISSFCTWFNGIKGYDKKIFIAGNHDRLFENDPEYVKNHLKDYPNIIYLQDESYGIYDLETDKTLNIYGSPWQPEFYSWAFNLPKNGIEIAGKWEAIPDNTDILITHGPSWGAVDTVTRRPWDNLGCELLAERIQTFRPKIHVCGHIHSGYGIETIDNIHYINASVLDEAYEYTQKPWNVEWDPETNELTVL
jgi:Icc-related predicted phosphoesterase